MIDVHAHILPDIDDGCPTLEAAVKVAKEAAKQGVTTIIATPHANDGIYSSTAEDIFAKCTLLNNELQQRGIAVDILPGAENRVTHDLMERWDQNDFLTLANTGRAVLLELANMFIPEGAIRTVTFLRERGVIPVIAHPERNPLLMKDLQLLKTLVYEGAKLQLTAASITGDFGKLVTKTAMLICELDAVYCVGSDIHPKRKYRMAKAYKKLKKIGGVQWADTVMVHNPAAIAFAAIPPESVNESH